MNNYKVNFIFMFFWALNFVQFNCDSTPTLPQRGVCAHRGANFSQPENTIAAFKEAIRLGAHMIEFDVQMSKDGELIILHDDTVDRTTNGTGGAVNLPFNELRELDAGLWKGTEFEGEKIPTLSETLDIMPRNIWLNVHIKSGAETGIKAASLILEKNRQHQAFLACKGDVAAAVRKFDSRIKICNMDRRDDPQDYVAKTIANKANFIQLTNQSDDQLPELIQQLKQANVKINYYGTNSPKRLNQLYNYGVDFPLVDNLEQMMETAKKIGIPPVVPVF